MGTPVHAIQVESLFFLNKETKSSLEMPNVKLTYFNLRGRGEPCRIMLAYGGIKYEDERRILCRQLSDLGRHSRLHVHQRPGASRPGEVPQADRPQGESGQCAQHQGVGGVQTKDRSLNCPLKKRAAFPL